MSSMFNDDFCVECRSIFEGHWKLREQNVSEDGANYKLDESFDTESMSDASGSDFYERPDWIQAPSEQDIHLAQSPRHHNIHELKICAVSGCKLCIMFYDQLCDLLPDLDQVYNASLDKAIGIATVRPSFVSADDDEAQSIPRTLDLEISYFVDGRCDVREAFIPLTLGFYLGRADEWLYATPDIPDTSSLIPAKTVQAITSWVTKCRDTHADCWQTAEAALKDRLHKVMPSRVLDVTAHSDDNSVRLVDSRHLPDKDRFRDYVTLSHCWGAHLPIRLLSSNYASFMQALDIQILPKTFRDAIVFTRALGVRYLWIDALCIIQDSKIDWLQESSLMASIYSCAYVNLAATSAVDGNGGLLERRQALRLSPCLVRASWTGHTPGHYVCWDQTTWEREIEQSVLSKRAWVFQERLLAPRTVHCAKTQVWWECRRMRANECFPEGLPDEMNNWNYQVVSSLAALEEVSIGDRISGNAHWLNLVERYTSAKLSKDSDRLIALSGVALVVSQSLGWQKEEYAAGLWKHDLLVDILWYMGEGTRKQDSYVAPSWSWASANGTVRFANSETRNNIRRFLCADVEQLVVDTEGDVFGLVKYGYLTIRAHVYRVCFSEPWLGELSHFGRVKFGPDQLELTQEDGQFDEAMDEGQLYDPTKTSQLHVFWCMISRSDTHVIQDQYVCYGLLLMKAPGHGAGVYQRVGESRLYFKDTDTHLIRQLSLHTDRIDALARHHDGRNTIMIV